METFDIREWGFEIRARDYKVSAKPLLCCQPARRLGPVLGDCWKHTFKEQKTGSGFRV